MAWHITCSDPACTERSGAREIVDLLHDDHLDEAGWFICYCGKRGYIKKSYKQQEGCYRWEPILKGAILLADPDATYQPFVFLVGYTPDGPPTDVWFWYYKDLRSSGGRLKIGAGPGG